MCERVDAARAALGELSPAGVFVDVVCDLQSFDSVRVAAERVVELCPEGLDVLCNNAGVMALPDRATAEGFDVQMQTNHLSHFLLTKRLFPLLERAASLRGEARIVNHSSMARHASRRLEAKYLERRGGDLGGDATRMFPVPGAAGSATAKPSSRTVSSRAASTRSYKWQTRPSRRQSRIPAWRQQTSPTQASKRAVWWVGFTAR